MSVPSEFVFSKSHSTGSDPACRLEASDVHLWSVTLDHFFPHHHEFLRMMSFDELVAAQKYTPEHEKHRFIASRGLLRYILSRYTGVEPRRLAVEYKGDDRARLPDSAGNELRFDLSRGAAAALYAVALNRPVGVGLAVVTRPDAGLAAWLPRLAEADRRSILDAGLPHRALALFQILTRHEALAHAQGGLAMAASASSAGATYTTVTSWRQASPGRWVSGGWAVEDVAVLKGYASAVAARDDDWRLRTIHIKPA